MIKDIFEDWSNDQLKSKVKELYDIKKYGLIWEESEDNEVSYFESNYPLLKERKDLSIEKSNNKNTNIIIKGENYGSLKVLRYTHSEKIDIIFIDPPYNTGNNDFKYNDNWVDIEDSYRHSKWLSFMSSRLKLAKELLKEDGVMFITIGEDELSQLTILCKQIFGRNNLINTLVWEKSTSRKNSSKYFSENHDYVLVVSKSTGANGWARKLDPRDEESTNYSNPDNDPRGPWTRGSVIANNPYGAKYEIKAPDGSILKKPENGYWRYSRESIDDFINEGRVIWGKKGTYPSIKKFKSDAIDGLVPKSILYSDTVGSNPDGAIELKEIFGGKKVFNYPKPTDLIIYLLGLHANKNATVLDFFAGSGTTGHAVLKKNALDGGERVFILCSNDEIGKEDEDEFIKNNGIKRKNFSQFISENPKKWDKFISENGIFSSVMYPRIQKIISGYEHSSKTKTLLQTITLNKSFLLNENSPKALSEELDRFRTRFDDNFEFKFKNNKLKIYGIKEKNQKSINYDVNLMVYELFTKKIINTDLNLIQISKYMNAIIKLKEGAFNKVSKNNGIDVYKDKNKKHTYILKDPEKLEEIAKITKGNANKSNLYIFSYSNEAYEHRSESLGANNKLHAYPKEYIDSLNKKF